MTTIDHIINIDSIEGRPLGFTSDKFDGTVMMGAPASYLWRKDDLIIISNIVSLCPGQGNFRALVANIEAQGLRVMVPAPSLRMKQILFRLGFLRSDSHQGEGGEFWVRATPEQKAAMDKASLLNPTNEITSDLAEKIAKGLVGTRSFILISINPTTHKIGHAAMVASVNDMDRLLERFEIFVEQTMLGIREAVRAKG